MIHPDELITLLNLLENSLSYWQHQEDGLRPMKDWEETDLRAYVAGLYRLAHECWYMQNRQDAPELLPYREGYQQWLTRPELIRLTRQCLGNCNLDQLEAYRGITYYEDWLIRCLEAMHNQLIGAYLFQHPAMETLGMQEIRFSR